MHSLAERLNIDVRPKRADSLAIHVIKGVSPCAAGGYSVEAILNMPEAEGLKQVAELLKTVGEVKLVEDFGVAMVGSKGADAKVFAGGQISAVSDTTKEASEFFDRVARAVLRANLCTKCGICVRACPTGAIKLDGRIIVDEGKCNLCGKCSESCVVAHYFDKLAGEVSKKDRPNEKKSRR
jgi:phosphoadenosine phosphosulfate reductase